MFGFVGANVKELNSEEQTRYGAVYCGICRCIREEFSSAARLGLRYDMAFLAMLLMSLYEPDETQGKKACEFHPLFPRPWVDNEYIRYCARMNVALAYYKSLDDCQDDGSLRGKLTANLFGKKLEQIRELYPRQYEKLENSIRSLQELEQQGCDNPDLPAGCFGELLGELLAYREDLWAPTLRQMGNALGRYIYLADAAMDYRKDQKKNRYNPFLALGKGENPKEWEQYLVLEMGRCTDYYERLPLVQDKSILDNILYSGIWVAYRKRLRSKQDDR